MATHPALPVVRDWSRGTAIDGTLTLIDEPHVHELLDAHTWLVRAATAISSSTADWE